jgi:hypothetical protein
LDPALTYYIQASKERYESGKTITFTLSDSGRNLTLEKCDLVITDDNIDDMKALLLGIDAGHVWADPIFVKVNVSSNTSLYGQWPRRSGGVDHFFDDYLYKIYHGIPWGSTDGEDRYVSLDFSNSKITRIENPDIDLPGISVSADRWTRDNIISVTLPKTLKYLGNESFKSCYYLKSVKLPVGLKEIGSEVFVHCRSLRELELPSTVTIIGPGAFMDCDFLTTINLPDGITVLESSLFKNCSRLEKRTLPESLITIKAEVFYNTGLKEITIPENVKTIGVSAFKNCTNLVKVHVKRTATPLTKLLERDPGNTPGSTFANAADSLAIGIPFATFGTLNEYTQSTGSWASYNSAGSDILTGE